MSRYERRIYFESLCQLRARYGKLGPEDRTSIISIDDVVSAVAVILAEPVAKAPDKQKR